MKKKIEFFALSGIFILLLFFGSIISIGSAKLENVFILYITLHKDDSVDFRSFELTEGKVNVYPSSGDYALKIISMEEGTLFSAEIPINFITFREWIDENGTMHGELIELETQDMYWRLPYFLNAERIELYHKEKLIFTLNIAKKLCIEDGKCLNYCKNKRIDPDCEIPATTPILITTTTTTITGCGNDICEKEENFGNCPQDCESGERDGYCDGVKDGICDPDCRKELDSDCKVAKCGDGKCEIPDESYGTCPQDCPSGSKDGFCDRVKDEKCDPDCSKEADKDCEKNGDRGGFPFFYLIGIIFIILLFGVIFFIYKRGKEGGY